MQFMMYANPYNRDSITSNVIVNFASAAAWVLETIHYEPF